MNRRLTADPAWCNSKHQPGSDPDRQTHRRRWVADLRPPSKYLPRGLPRFRISMVPSGGGFRGTSGFVVLELTGLYGKWEILRVDELRRLIEDLTICADAADEEHSREKAAEMADLL